MRLSKPVGRPWRRNLSSSSYAATPLANQPIGEDALRWLATLKGPSASFMVLKADSKGADSRGASPHASLSLVPVIDSGRAGFAGNPLTASVASVLRLVFGHSDFIADTGMAVSDDEQDLTPLRLLLR